MKRRTYLALFLTLLLGGGVVVFHATTFSSGIARAQEFQSTEQVQFTFNSTISVNITGGDLVIESLTPGDGKDSNIITVTASSNAAAGYNVYGSVGSDTITNTNLTHTNGSNTFTSINTTTALNNFQDNQWGYAYSTDSGSTWVSGNVGSTNVGYNGLPLYNGTDKTAGVLLASTTTPISSSFQFKIGAKASSTQIAGEYTNVINFIGITNPDPEPPVAPGECTDEATCMQTSTACDTTLTDARDGSTYTVATINGQCWMTQNLRITGTIAAEYSNFSGSDFNVSAGSLTSGNSFTEARTAYNNNTGYGAYYNYCAASAGTVCNDTTKADATVDICPAGWALPTQAQFSGLPTNESHFTASSGLAGYYDDGSLDSAGDEGNWLSATAYDTTNQYSLYYNSIGDDWTVDSNYKSSGNSIRCVRSS